MRGSYVSLGVSRMNLLQPKPNLLKIENERNTEQPHFVIWPELVTAATAGVLGTTHQNTHHSLRAA